METIALSAEAGIAVIRLNRPRSLNAINEAMVSEIEAALDRCEADRSIRAVVFTGTGRAFCVGSDLKEGADKPEARDPEGRIARMHRLILRMDDFPKLTVAAINGLALGGGLEIALASTLRVAACEARMGLPEITHSLMPAYGGTQLLPRLIGLGRALELALTGEMIGADRALAIGLVNEVAADAQAAAVALATRCSKGSILASREIRRAMLGGVGLPLAAGLALEEECALRTAASEEARVGLDAFAWGSRPAKPR